MEREGIEENTEPVPYDEINHSPVLGKMGAEDRLPFLTSSKPSDDDFLDSEAEPTS